MNNILDDSFIQNQYLISRRMLFYTEVKRYVLWVCILLLYVFVMSYGIQKSQLNQFQRVPIRFILFNTLLIYALVSCIFGIFIAAFEYKGLNYRQRFIRATVMLMASILFIIAAIFTVFVVISYFLLKAKSI